MPDDADLLRHLTRLLNGSVSLDEFRHWFRSALWEIESAGNEDMIDFAYLVEHRLAEYSGGHVDEARLLTVLVEDVKHFATPSTMASRASR